MDLLFQHEPSPAITLHGSAERPEFHRTTDLRATSDTLWCLLANFRKHLMDGGTFVAFQWAKELDAIGELAREVGLEPDRRNTPARHVAIALETLDRSELGYDRIDEPVTRSTYVLFPAGAGGTIQVHDLKDGFAVSKGGFSAETVRHGVIAWAEEWMNARERQLCGGGDRNNNHPPKPPPHGAVDRSVRKPAGWTTGELCGEAEIGHTVFGRIRRRAQLKASPRGGAGTQRRFSNADLRRLIVAAETGPYRKGTAIGAAWRQLFSTSQKSNHQ